MGPTKKIKEVTKLVEGLIYCNKELRIKIELKNIKIKTLKERIKDALLILNEAEPQITVEGTWGIYDPISTVKLMLEGVWYGL